MLLNFFRQLNLSDSNSDSDICLQENILSTSKKFSSETIQLLDMLCINEREGITEKQLNILNNFPTKTIGKAYNEVMHQIFTDNFCNRRSFIFIAQIIPVFRTISPIKLDLSFVSLCGYALFKLFAGDKTKRKGLPCRMMLEIALEVFTTYQWVESVKEPINNVKVLRKAKNNQNFFNSQIHKIALWHKKVKDIEEYRYLFKHCWNSKFTEEMLNKYRKARKEDDQVNMSLTDEEFKGLKKIKEAIKTAASNLFIDSKKKMEMNISKASQDKEKKIPHLFQNKKSKHLDLEDLSDFSEFYTVKDSNDHTNKKVKRNLKYQFDSLDNKNFNHLIKEDIVDVTDKFKNNFYDKIKIEALDKRLDVQMQLKMDKKVNKCRKELLIILFFGFIIIMMIILTLFKKKNSLYKKCTKNYAIY
ncbi:hypothetical protein NUSPORA_02638 [Nucleospora cyclopteri]